MPSKTKKRPPATSQDHGGFHPTKKFLFRLRGILGLMEPDDPELPEEFESNEAFWENMMRLPLVLDPVIQRAVNDDIKIARMVARWCLCVPRLTLRTRRYSAWLKLEHSLRATVWDALLGPSRGKFERTLEVEWAIARSNWSRRHGGRNWIEGFTPRDVHTESETREFRTAVNKKKFGRSNHRILPEAIADFTAAGITLSDSSIPLVDDEVNVHFFLSYFFSRSMDRSDWSFVPCIARRDIIAAISEIPFDCKDDENMSFINWMQEDAEDMRFVDPTESDSHEWCNDHPSPMD